MSDGDEPGLDEPWPPSDFALAFDRYDHPSDEGRSSIVIGHPTAPFVRPLGGSGSDPERALQQIAHGYLVALDQLLRARGHESGLGLPRGWLEALAPGSGDKGFFGWLPIRPSFLDDGAASDDEAAREAEPHPSSLRVLRSERPLDPSIDMADPAVTKDTTVVMVASEFLLQPDLPLNSDFGLQVFLHFRKDAEAADVEVAITSMTANLPYGRYSTWLGALIEARSAALSGFQALMRVLPAYPSQGNGKENPDDTAPEQINPVLNFLAGIVEEETPNIATLFQLRPDITYDRLRIVRLQLEDGTFTIEFELGGKGLGIFDRDTFETPYDFAVTIVRELFSDGSTRSALEPVSKSVLVTHASPPGQARIFEQDPPSRRDLDNLHQPPECYDWSSRRPTRSEEQLDAFRRTIGIGGGQHVPLEDPQGAPSTFAVRNCPNFARSDPDNADTKTLTLPPDVWPRVREDDHSAASAYYNCLSVFTAMRGFGIDPVIYFRATEQPFDVFYRSGISPGPGKSGQTINARVLLEPSDGTSFLQGVRCSMSMHLALANFSHRARWVPDSGEPTWAEPLGIATSERWMWHEFGHAFIAGRLARLELPFVHSVGDALAAIAADPISRLAEPRVPADPDCRQTDPRDQFDRFRGYTFPFVFLTRRHDRCVRNGWSWGGTFHRSVIEAAETSRDQFKGYISEQILSSTLFRLYRVLGGDTIDVGDGGPDYETRRTASDVVIFLIMRSLEMSGMTPAWAEELENLLIQADLGLTSPLGARTALEDAPAYTAGHDWRGGQAHKVIRWAFEAQGMHLPDPDHIRNDVGDPPPVDIYIEDLRPTTEKTDGSDVDHGPGTYVPVSLDWAGVPKWHAGSFADLPFPIVVKNRGDQPATGVSVRAWFGWADGDSETSGWDRTTTIQWLSPINLTFLTTVIERRRQLTLDFPPTPTMPTAISAILPTHLFVLIEATCPDDRANSDPVAGLPCAIDPTGTPPDMPRALADLVANDNNLALWMQRL